MLFNFVKYFDRAAGLKEVGWKNLIKNFNDSNIRGGYQVKYRESGGTQLFNNKGDEVTIPIGPALENPY